MLPSHLTALENLGLVTPAAGAGRYLFRHALIQDAAYGSLLKADRRTLHLVVGETLERLYAGHLHAPELTPQLARHFDEAQEPGRALKYYTLAGDTAAEHYATLEASEHYAHAITLAVAQTPLPGEQLDYLYTRLGRMLEVAGRYAEAGERYRELLALAQAHGLWALEITALMALALIHALITPVHDSARGEAYATAALALAQAHHDRAAEARLNWILLLKSWFAGDAQAGETYGLRALALARELELRELLAYVLNDLGAHVYSGTGQNARAIALLTEALELWRALNNIPMLVDNLNNLANLYQFKGDYPQALAFAQEGYLLARAIGNAWGLGYNRVVRAFIHFNQGECDAAQVVFAEAQAFGQQGGLMFAVVFPGLFLGILAWQLAAPAFGLPRLAPAIAQAEAHLPVALADLYAVRSALEWQTGDQVAAATSLALSRAQTWERGPAIWGFGVQLIKCDWAWHHQEYADLAQLGAQLTRQFQQVQVTMFLLEALRYQALGLRGLGQTAAALAVAQQGLAYPHLRRTYWQTLLLLADLEAELGDLAAAAQHRAAAQAEVAYLLEHLHEPTLRVALEMKAVNGKAVNSEQ